ncbi:hypothetical protein K8R04_00385 [Candidatus Uhrbacteria bacterium]|nr:hypothetical protein [Candidatus Uhrbacteria bacterium]
MALIIAFNSRYPATVKSQSDSSSLQTQSEQMLFNDLQRLETENKDLKNQNDELTQNISSNSYILSGLIGPGRLVRPQSPTDWGTFRVPNGGSFTVATGCGGGQTVRHTDKFTITNINVDKQTRAWSIEMKRTDTFEMFSYDEENSTEELSSSTTTKSTLIIKSDDSINSMEGLIGSGTDYLLPILVTPEDVYFVRGRYAC